MESYKCECGWEPRENSLNKKLSLSTHKKMHCKLRDTKDESKCSCKDGGSWRFLSRKNPAESRAIDSGYTRLCQNCGEVE